MDIDPSSLSQSSVRDWSELPLDPLSKIFMKLGTIEILMGAGLVCRSWLAAAKTPELWRFVDMTCHKFIFSKDITTMCAMAKVAVDRSAGQMESFWAQKFVTDELLDYISARAKSLKSIRLIACGYFWDPSLVKLAEECSILEEIECSYLKMSAELFRHIGPVRPQLKRLRIHIEEWYDSDQVGREMEEEYCRSCGYEEEESEEESPEDWEARQNEVAFAIASLHELRVLQISGNSLTNKGLCAILEGCPHLECLDISECNHVCVNNKLQARCAKLKHFVWLPRQRDTICCPDLEITVKYEGEDYMLNMPDWSSDHGDMDTGGDAEMDDGSYGNYWQETPPSSSDDPPGPDLSNVTCDDTRFYTEEHEYYPW